MCDTADQITFEALEARGFVDRWPGDQEGDALFTLTIGNTEIAVCWDRHLFSHWSVGKEHRDDNSLAALDLEIHRLINR